MNNEMEKNLRGDTPIPLDAEDASTERGTGATEGAGRRRRCGETSCEEQDEAPFPEFNDPTIPDELEEQVRNECRRTCRRHFWAELLKTIAKVAGVVLAAFGLSSFDQED